MTTMRNWCVLAGFVMLAGVAFAEGAQLSVAMVPDFPLYRGDVVPVDISVTLPPDGPEAPRALALMLNPSATVSLHKYHPNPSGPEGEDTAGDFFIAPGRDSAGFYAISWIDPPETSFSFRLYLVLNQNNADRLSIEHYSILRYGEGPIESPHETLSTVWQPTKHDADTLSPTWEINLNELLRAIQFYNSYSLHCEVGSEDGYAPGPGDHDCENYDLDYRPQDWIVSLSELLRLIQFYNSGGYFPLLGTEDNYAPIPKPQIYAAPPIIGPGQTTKLRVSFYFDMVPVSITVLDYTGIPLGEAEFVSQDGPNLYTYQFTSPGGYTGQVLLKTVTTGWYNLTLETYNKDSLEMDSTPPTLSIAGPYLENNISPYYRIDIYDETADINLDEDHIGVQSSGSIACGFSIEPEVDVPGGYRVYLTDCTKVGDIAIYLKAGTAVDPQGNASAETPPSNSYRYVQPEESHLFPSLSTSAPYFYVGRSIDITLDIATEETAPVTGLGVILSLPPGWRFNAVHPELDTMILRAVTGKSVEMTWINVPPVPAQFTFNLSPPDNAAATATFTANVSYYRQGTGRQVGTPQAQLSLSRLGTPEWHSVDYNPRDYAIGLSELLRAIQFYSLGGYHCDSTTEDGYAPGPGLRDCAPHTGDYNALDWRFSFSELLRLIQLSQSREYHTDPTTEDGFAPGPPPN